MTASIFSYPVLSANARSNLVCKVTFFDFNSEFSFYNALASSLADFAVSTTSDSFVFSVCTDFLSSSFVDMSYCYSRDALSSRSLYKDALFLSFKHCLY